MLPSRAAYGYCQITATICLETGYPSLQEQAQIIQHVLGFRQNHRSESADALERLQAIARDRGNVFAELMETVKSSSLGQISAALYDVGGEYRGCRRSGSVHR